MEANTRQPAVAGVFYPKKRQELESALYALIPQEAAHHELLACISPHAGYVYSGSVAGRLFAHLTVPERVIILGPNHTGIGEKVAVAPHSGWETPLGEQPVDTDFARRLVDVYPAAEFDPRAHWREHSVEVQIPFLRRRRPDLLVLPVVLGHLSLDECLELGHVIAGLISGFDEPVGIVASSDMSHFQPDETTRTLDHLAIDAALERDPVGLFETVRKEGISMCGVIPATIALVAANELGAVDAHLVAYATSGDVSGDYSSVVGYAGVCIHR